MNSDLIDNHRSESNDIHLSETDLAILRQLALDARIANKELAARVGIAASTCSGRVAALRRRGVIRGFRVDIDLERLGLHVAGMISVRLTPIGRSQLSEVIARLIQVPETLDIFQVSGERDLLVHIATDHPSGLHRFIEEHLSDTAIAHTQTSLVFSRHST